MVDRTSVVALCAVFLLFQSTLEQVAEPLNSGVERLALLELRSSLGLRAREWPIRADHCAIWVGVRCQNGSVSGINISGFKRTRVGRRNPQFAVDALANFTFLRSFNASNFLLPGSIPDWFGQRLTSLQVLDLRSCSIVGAIPSSLGNLANLTSLYLSYNSLAGIIPADLGQLSRLSFLDLAHNSITGSFPSFFTSLVNLALLDLSSNFLSGTIPAAIGTLLKLRVLNLSNNSFSSSIPIQLGYLSGLIDLDLSSNSLSGSLPSDLRGLRSLQKMVIGRNFLSGPLPGSLFLPLTQLQFVVLNHNNFTGNLPALFWTMPRLHFLDASENSFTGALPNLTSAAITSAAIFNLSRNMFYGSLTSTLRRFSVIDLSRNYFQGAVLDHTNASFTRNCLRNTSDQRTMADCASFYIKRGLSFDNFGMSNASRPLPDKPHEKSHKTWVILAGVLGSLGFIALVVFVLVLLVICTRKRNRTTQRSNGVGPVPTNASPLPSGVSLNFSSLGDQFTYQQILKATSDFSDKNLIKRGHSGDFFRGNLEGGIPVAIKRVDLSYVKKEAYMLELDFFSNVSHPRVVPLLGHCLENENQKFLIYKYMPNGDLSNSLFRKTSSIDDSLQSLDWITRLKIALGAAEGLSYLHHECTPPLVHRDVQASSILLDDKFEVRLGSLSDVCAQEGDSYQNRITRFLWLTQTSEQGASGTPAATCAYDVYCFGKVLLELVTGKLGISAYNDAAMKDYLESTMRCISIYDKELVTNIIDPSLVIDEDLLEEVWAMAVVARSCLNPKPSRRPLMRYILRALENPLKVVREENTHSARLRTASSRGSWNAVLFGSWRHSSSDVAIIPAAPTSRLEGGGSGLKQSGTTGSQGSDQNGSSQHSSSTRRQCKDVIPEPLEDVQDVVERPTQG